ncbi:MAG TPA: 4'-phosphopantetheinyl transferase superfamily protein [Vicinamibacterales bacterium]|nr:4'-phosphopantetheinyl transferase superfamily protein [Vicinamibacterales bacterium]
MTDRRRPVVLEEGVAHACIVPLHAGPQTVRRMYALLSPAERVRAARFAFDRDRRTFVMSHGILRRVLGMVCHQNPAQLRFRQGLRGKPYLVDAPPGLQFNLSHTEGFCLVGVTRGAAIGVDVERVRATDDMAELVRQCFSPAEQRAFDTLPPAERCRGFFKGWTRKEAFIKALGDGLSYPLENFDVSLGPDGPARLLAIGGSAAAAAEWSMDALEPAPDVQAAVAVAAPGVTVRWHALPEMPARIQTEDVHGRGTRRHDHVPGREEPRRAVFDLASRP